MKTLNDCKDEVAKKNYYNDWDSLVSDCFSVPSAISFMDEAAILFASEALKHALKEYHTHNFSVIQSGGTMKTIDDVILSIIDTLK